MSGPPGGWAFAAVAAALVLLAVAFVLPWRECRRRSAAAGVAPPATSPRGRGGWRIAIVLALPVAAVALYLRLGDPAAIDPQRERLSALWRGSGPALDDEGRQRVYEALQQHLQRQREDARAWAMKARMDMRAQRFEAAAAAYGRALQGPSRTGGDAVLWVEYAEARAMLQGGALAGEPRELVGKALAVDPDQPKALDLAGSAAWEAGEFEQAVQHWQRLLAQIPQGHPRYAQLSAAIEAARKRARLTLPPPR